MAKQEKTKKSITVRSMSDLAELKLMLEDDAEDITPEQQDTFAQRAAFQELRNPTHNIVSIVAFLIGVEKKHFENEHEPPQMNIFEQLQDDRAARIVRNLCMVRTAIEQKYIAISNAFRMQGKNIGTMPDMIPSEAVNELHSDGVQLYMGKPEVDAYLVKINQEISNRINTIAYLFPEWVKWEYVKPLFLMPNGTKASGIKEAGLTYNADRKRYPYQCWLNWDAISVGTSNQGNILFTDEKFLTLLYQRHEDRFENLSLVRDVGNQTMRNLSNLLNSCDKCVIVVDCENSNAVKLAAALSSLPKSEVRKISKVLLFDSEYTTPEWKTLVDKFLKMVRDSVSYTDGDEWMRLEHIMVPRLNQSKSQVDMTLAVRTSREVYSNNVDSVILVSSDSDYWAMIKQLEGVRFLVMLEKEKTGLAIMDTLTIHSIHYCFLDDFCTSASYKIKTETLIDAIQTRIDAILHGEEQAVLNVKEIMESYLRESWIEMTTREKDAFYERYLRKMKLIVEVDGNVNIQIPTT